MPDILCQSGTWLKRQAPKCKSKGCWAGLHSAFIWLWVVGANQSTVLAVPPDTFEVIFTFGTRKHTHSYVPTMSLRSVCFVGRVWFGKKQRDEESQGSPKYGSFSHGVQIQQTNNSQQNHGQYQSTNMWTTSHVIFVSYR